jgi:hypothetical protein
MMLRLTVALSSAILFSFSLIAAGHDLTPSPPTANQVRPVVTGNGSGFAVAWVELGLPRNTVVSQTGADGEPIKDAGHAVDQPSFQSIAIGQSPSDALAVWIADGNVFAKRLLPSGIPQNTILLTPAKAYPSNVAVVWNGSRYFAVWSTASQLVGAFIAPDGSPTLPHPFFSEPSLAPREPVIPDVAWNGQLFVVVFGELSYPPCVVTCPAPNPDQFRVMRVSAGGDAIDSSPLVITGRHLRAHVASIGAESLIALDSLGGVSTIIAHDQSGLTLDAETPLFRWFSDVASAVVWDGATYTVGWRYVGAQASWLGAASVTRSGLPFDYRFTAAGGPLPYGFTLDWGQPSIAVNEAGVMAFAISEASSSFARARLYLAPELAPMPVPPPAPRNVVSSFGGTTARIDWQSDDAATGFAIDAWYAPENSWYVYRTAPGDARTITISTSIGSLFRIRAFGPGGVSEGTITSIGSMQRRRAERH